MTEDGYKPQPHEKPLTEGYQPIFITPKLVPPSKPPKSLNYREGVDEMTEEKFSNEILFFRKELDIDIIESYKKLKCVGELKVDELKDRFKLSESINSAARNSLLARMMFLKARKEVELFRIEHAQSMRKLNRLAIARVETWLANTIGTRKQITKEMVEEEICAMEDTREEYRLLLRRQEELREIRDNLETLADEWSARKSTLQSQASLLKAQREVVLGGHDGKE